MRLRKQRSSNIVQKIKPDNLTKYLIKSEEIAESFADFHKTLNKNSDTSTKKKKYRIDGTKRFNGKGMGGTD